MKRNNFLSKLLSCLKEAEITYLEHEILRLKKENKSYQNLISTIKDREKVKEIEEKIKNNKCLIESLEKSLSELKK